MVKWRRRFPRAMKNSVKSDGQGPRLRGFRDMVNCRFPSDLLYRVLEDVEERGFCVLGAEEIDRLLPKGHGNPLAKREALQEFATLSGLKMETTPNLNAARFENPLNEKT